MPIFFLFFWEAYICKLKMSWWENLQFISCKVFVRPLPVSSFWLGCTEVDAPRVMHQGRCMGYDALGGCTGWLSTSFNFCLFCPFLPLLRNKGSLVRGLIFQGVLGLVFFYLSNRIKINVGTFHIVKCPMGCFTNVDICRLIVIKVASPGTFYCTEMCENKKNFFLTIKCPVRGFTNVNMCREWSW